MTALFDKMHAALVEAQQERPDRQEVLNGELDWVTHERTIMHNAVNAARAARFLPPVPITAIQHVEQQAEGHSDYTQKFALYCAELVRKEQP